LDEPTNHLDLWARDALEKALRQFEGTVLLVSHDRYLVNRVADHLLVAEPDRFRVIEGNYETYQHLVALRRAGEDGRGRLADGQAKGAAGPQDTASKNTRKDGPKPRKRRFPYRKAEDIEREIAEEESKLEALHGLLVLPETHRAADRVRDVMAQIDERQSAIKTLYAHWEEAVELNW
ncbi:MAG: hypothetical protein JW888_13590, partial [Pirellulales bacterium]|nr:hypothetical protein [Pirellulales bacterium]